jgi:GT2 family glycosyltransferase
MLTANLTSDGLPDGASVVIATKDRPDDLLRCLRALAAQATSRSIEVVVVDDGSTPPVIPEDLHSRLEIRLLCSKRSGPAAARNLGIQGSRGAVVLFTDDDTVPSKGWIDAACAFLDAHTSHAGVEGPVDTPPFDWLYEHSLANDAPGAYWTCNIAYRRHVLEQLGGFCEDFPFPHCEDRDLAYRALEVGPVGFAAEMCVTHTPSRQSLLTLIRRGRFGISERLLFVRHPDYYRRHHGRLASLPSVVVPLLNAVRFWLRALRREGPALFISPRRLLRFVIAAIGSVASATIATIQDCRTAGYRSSSVTR